MRERGCLPARSCRAIAIRGWAHDRAARFRRIATPSRTPPRVRPQPQAARRPQPRQRGQRLPRGGNRHTTFPYGPAIAAAFVVAAVV